MQETDHDEKRNWIRHSEFERKKARSSSKGQKGKYKTKQIFWAYHLYSHLFDRHPCPEGGKSEPYLAGVGNLSQNFQVFSAEYKWYIFKYGGVLSFTSKSLSRKLWFDGFNPWCTVIHQAITIQLNSCFCAWTSWLTRSLVTWHNFWRRSFDSEQQAYPDLTLLARLVRSKANCATAHKPLL